MFFNTSFVTSLFLLLFSVVGNKYTANIDLYIYNEEYQYHKLMYQYSQTVEFDIEEDTFIIKMDTSECKCNIVRSYSDEIGNYYSCSDSSTVCVYDTDVVYSTNYYDGVLRNIFVIKTEQE